MPETNGTTHSNGVVASNGVIYDDERNYYCPHCGRWLVATTMALGPHGTTRIRCPESACRQYVLLKLGQEPRPRPDRAAWVRTKQLDRQLDRQVADRAGTRY